jgi:multidrug efflux pump subunit AcrA (membrane-fusion protein)
MAAVVRALPEKNEKTVANDLLVPPGAVFTVEAGQQSYVWVAEEDGTKAVRRAVTTGELTPEGIRITAGLKAGEWVVTAGVHSLRENQSVTILREGSR